MLLTTKEFAEPVVPFSTILYSSLLVSMVRSEAETPTPDAFMAATMPFGVSSPSAIAIAVTAPEPSVTLMVKPDPSLRVWDADV